MMKLVIDIGNTLTKVAVFDSKEMVLLEKFQKLSSTDIEKILNRWPGISSAIISAVTDIPDAIIAYIKKHIPLLILDENTAVPLSIQYKTPASLGADRLAAVVAAQTLFPAQNTLVIETGTCITYDFLDEGGVYHGGSISPGIGLRFRALHNFTGKLPLIEPKQDAALIGTSTESSILSGVINGVEAELLGIISRYEGLYKNLTVILSGGNLNYFDKNLKNNIFAVPNIVLSGLNIILEFNDKN